MENYELQYRMFVNDVIQNTIIKKQTIWTDNINPDTILNSIDENDMDDSFWSHHGESVLRYKELVINYNKALIVISFEGGKEHLSSSDPILLAYQVFHGTEPIRLIDYNGTLIIEGNGRHRIAAAKLLKKEGIDVSLSGLVTQYVSAKNEIKNNISSINSSVTNMGNYQIEGQVELLREAKRLFSQHAEKVQELTEEFNSGVRALEQENLNHDYMDFLEEFLADYVAQLKTIRETIEDEYLPQLERKIRYLDERE